MSTYLPDTALTALSVNKDVYTYAQTNDGSIIECQGQLRNVQANPPDTYRFSHRNHVISRYDDDEVNAGAPKLFTPLAAAHIGSTRYLLYVDDNNMIHGLTSPGTSGPWPEDTGVSRLQVYCAHYSQLTAISFAKNGFEAICLYYQTPQLDAAITVFSYSTKTRTWNKSLPDMTPNPPPPPPRIVDPPLYGTSMTAVPTRRGIELVSNSIMPVVYLQWDNLALAHSQEKSIRVIPDTDLRFSPHTSLTAVDDGENLCFFYTSSKDNFVKMMMVKDGTAKAAIRVGTPTPRSAIAAVLPTKDRIVLFYQCLDDSLAKVDLVAVTFTRVQNAAPDSLPFAQGRSTKLR